MNTKSKILIGLVLIAMGISVWFTYQRFFITQDFTIISSLARSIYA